jgi:hypothetical protein
MFMNPRIVPRAAGRLGVIAAVLCGLAGCVAYVPPQTTSYSYYDSKGNLVNVQTVPQSPAPVYVAPAPAYVAPAYVAPAYVGPPVYLGFGFGFYNSWGGHRGGWHRHRW